MCAEVPLGSLCMLLAKEKFSLAYYNLGVFYEFHLKDSSRALATYKKYLELGGKDERIQRIVRDVGK